MLSFIEFTVAHLFGLMIHFPSVHLNLLCRYKKYIILLSCVLENSVQENGIAVCMQLKMRLHVILLQVMNKLMLDYYKHPAKESQDNYVF